MINVAQRFARQFAGGIRRRHCAKPGRSPHEGHFGVHAVQRRRQPSQFALRRRRRGFRGDDVPYAASNWRAKRWPRLSSRIRHGHRHARFFTVYGPRHDRIWRSINLPIDHRREADPGFRDGSTARDYTFVTDTVDGVMACTEREIGFDILIWRIADRDT